MTSCTPNKKISRNSFCNKNQTEKKNEVIKKKQSKQNNFTKSNLSNIAAQIHSNNSALTQRHRSCSKNHNNPETSDKTMKLKESQKRLVKTKTSCKKNKPSEVSKVPQDLNGFIQNKLSVKTSRNSGKRSKSAFNSIRIDGKHTGAIDLNSSLKKVEQNLCEGTQKIIDIKKSSDGFVLDEMRRVQKALTDKIDSLQKKNEDQANLNESKFEFMKTEYKAEATKFKEEIFFLNAKVEQQNNKNITLQSQCDQYEKDIHQMKTCIQQKDRYILTLEKENKSLCNLSNNSKNDSTSTNATAPNGANTHQNNAQVCVLKEKVEVLTQEKINLMKQLKKHQEEKQVIKQNSIDVLNILREQFGKDNQNFISVAVEHLAK